MEILNRNLGAGLRAVEPAVPEEERIAVVIGIDHGEVVCGSTGHRERLELALVGDTVNVATRVQGLARSGETLVTARVAEAISDELVGSRT